MTESRGFKLIGALKLSLIFASLFFSANGQAFGDLYEVSLKVEKENHEAEDTLIKKAFINVLTQVTGSDKILATVNVKKAMESPDDFVRQFRYKLDAEKQRFLLVKFDEIKINMLVENADCLAWNGNRPKTTAWVVVARDKDKPNWVGGEFEPELFQEIKSLANQRALPIEFPLLDLTDTALVTEQSVWKSELESVKNASKRYPSDMIWLGKISKQNSGWHGQWTLLGSKEPIVWDNTNTDVVELCRLAMDELSQRLLKTSTSVESEGISDEMMSDPVMVSGKAAEDKTATLTTPSRFTLNIAGIKGMEHYGKILSYLKTLPEMLNVDVQQISNERTVFNISTKMSRQALVENLARGPLVPENATALEKTVQAPGNETVPDNASAKEVVVLTKGVTTANENIAAPASAPVNTNANTTVNPNPAVNTAEAMSGKSTGQSIELQNSMQKQQNESTESNILTYKVSEN